MPNINEIFTKAIAHARSVMGDVVIALKKSNKEMFASLEDKNDLSTGKIITELKAVDNSIKNKEITKEVAVTNLKEITDSAKEIVATLKNEISKLDKEVIINTDISELIGFFKEKEKEKEEKIDEDEILFKYLDKIQNTLENIDITFPEAIDNTNLLNKIAKAIESKTNEKLEVLLQEIKDKESIFPSMMDVNLNPNLIDNNRVRVILRDDQVANIASSSNTVPVVNAMKDGTAKAQLVDDGGRVASVDDSTNSLQTIEYEHHEIHSSSFYRSGYQKDIPTGGTSIWAITTPNTTKWLHFRPAVDVELEAEIAFYENPTSVAGGTAIIPRNANRNSINTSGATVVTDPTINLTGAIPLGMLVEGSGKSSGGNSSAVNEWILEQNTTYVLVVTNQANASNEVNIRNSWYEHTEKTS